MCVCVCVCVGAAHSPLADGVMRLVLQTIASVLQHGPCIEFSLVHTQGSKLVGS